MERLKAALMTKVTSASKPVYDDQVIKTFSQDKVAKSAMQSEVSNLTIYQVNTTFLIFTKFLILEIFKNIRI